MSSEAKLQALDQITAILKRARQNAMLGSYAEAQTGLLHVIGLLRELQQSSENRDKYAKAIRDLEEEYTAIGQNLRICNEFSGKPPPPSVDFRMYKKQPSSQRPQPPSYNDHVPVSIYSKGETIQQSQGDYSSQPPKKLFERFGGKAPFAHHSSDPDNFEETSSGWGKQPPRFNQASPIHRQASGPPHQQATNDVVYYVQKYPREGLQEDRDPDVWEPPAQGLDKYGRYVDRKRPERRPQYENNPRGLNFVKEVRSNPSIPSRKELANRYQMPGMTPAAIANKKGNNGGKKKKPTGDESEFFLHHYPEGDGPDADLIRTLERDMLDKNPNVNFEDIAELKDAKRVLQEAVLLPLLMPEYFKGIRRPWKGVLLFGPPGTGKTMLAKALATQGKTRFFNVSASSLASKWRGDAEKLVRILFEMAHFYAPSVIFFDEIDALTSKRGGDEHEASRRLKTELFVRIDGVSESNSAHADAEQEDKKMVMVLGATNRPWDIDEAMIRRLEKRIYIPLPTGEGRKQLFKINLKKVKVSDSVNFDLLVKRTENYSGADISSLCREAAMMPMRDKLAKGTMFDFDNLKKLGDEIERALQNNDFLEALKNIKRSVSVEFLSKYSKWLKDFGAV